MLIEQFRSRNGKRLSVVSGRETVWHAGQLVRLRVRYRRLYRSNWSSTQRAGGLAFASLSGCTYSFRRVFPTSFRRAARVWWLAKGCHFQFAFWVVICWYTKWIVFSLAEFRSTAATADSNTPRRVVSIKTAQFMCILMHATRAIRQRRFMDPRRASTLGEGLTYDLHLPHLPPSIINTH